MCSNLNSNLIEIMIVSKIIIVLVTQMRIRWMPKRPGSGNRDNPRQLHMKMRSAAYFYSPCIFGVARRSANSTHLIIVIVAVAIAIARNFF